MTTTDRATHRRRRMMMAADGAHAWARSLQLGNPYAKSILLALTLYINDECSTFVGIPTLAEDTDLSQDTVRKRLNWLEEIGAVARIPRWRDEKGLVNTQGRGKRTTDDIKLLVDVDADEIEARATGREYDIPGEENDSETEFSPSHQQGLNKPEKTVRTLPALGQPSDSGKGLILEREPLNNPPNPPPGGVCSTSEVEEPKHFAGFKLEYPDREVWHWNEVLPVFAAMPENDQEWARAAVPLYAKQIGKKQKPMRPTRWLKNRIFANYETAKLPPAPPPIVWISEAEGHCLEVLGRIVDRSPTKYDDPKNGRGYKRSSPISSDLAALSQFRCSSEDMLDWPVVEPETREFKAWRARLHEWTGLWIDPRTVLRRGKKIKEMLPGKPMEVQNRTSGIPVPTMWPPRKDGSLYEPPHAGYGADDDDIDGSALKSGRA